MTANIRWFKNKIIIKKKGIMNLHQSSFVDAGISVVGKEKFHKDI